MQTHAPAHTNIQDYKAVKNLRFLFKFFSLNSQSVENMAGGLWLYSGVPSVVQLEVWRFE